MDTIDVNNPHGESGDSAEDAEKQLTKGVGIDKIALAIVAIFILVLLRSCDTWKDRDAFTSVSNIHEEKCKLLIQEGIENASTRSDYATLYLQAPPSPTEKWAYGSLEDLSNSFDQLAELENLQKLKRRYAEEIICKPIRGGYEGFLKRKLCAWDTTFTLHVGQPSDLIELPDACRMEWEYSEIYPLRVNAVGKGVTTYLPEGHPADENQLAHRAGWYKFSIPRVVQVPGYDDIRVPDGAAMQITLRYVPCD